MNIWMLSLNLKMKWIKNIFYLLTFLFLTMIIVQRFKPKTPYNIFEVTNITIGFTFLIIFIINLSMLIIIIIMYIKQNTNKLSFISIMANKIKTVIENSNKLIMDYIINFTFSINLDYLIPTLTDYYLKIPILLIQIFTYIPRVILLISITIDVLYFQRFEYSYIALYGLIFPLLLKCVLYISIHFNDRVLWEITESIVIVNTEKAIRGEPLLLEDYALTEKNTQFESVGQILRLEIRILHEIDRLIYIKEKTEVPLLFHLFIRIFYTLIWGYILYNYPVPIITIVIFLVKKFFITYITINVTILISGLIFLYFKDKNKKDES